MSTFQTFVPHYSIYMNIATYPFSLYLIGIAVGHIYFFLEDVFPEQPGGFKILRTPAILLVFTFVHTFMKLI